MKAHYPSEGGMSNEKFQELMIKLRKVDKIPPENKDQYMRVIFQDVSFEEQKELYRFFSLVTSHLMQEFWR